MKVAKEREEELRQKMQQQAAPKCAFTLKIEAPSIPTELPYP